MAGGMVTANGDGIGFALVDIIAVWSTESFVADTLTVFAFRIVRTLKGVTCIDAITFDFAITGETSFTFALVASNSVGAISINMAVIENWVSAFIDVNAFTIDF